MVADCGANCARWLLCLSNFFFIVISAGVLVVGTWVAVSKETFIELYVNISTTSPLNPTEEKDASTLLREFVEPAVIDQAGYLLIALGAFIFIISFLGYCGSIKESRVLLTAYGIFLLIIFCLQIALIILVTVWKPETDVSPKGFLEHSLTKYYTIGKNKDAVSLSWDMIMATMGCCGVNGAQDFKTSKLFVMAASAEGLDREIPESCCFLTGDTALIQPKEPTCIRTPTQDNSYLNTGCYDKLIMLIQDYLNLVIGAVVIVVAVQLLAIIFSFCLCRAVGKERDYSHYKY